MRYKKLLEARDEDPLAGVANLFDVGMVLVAALILALAVAWKTNPSGKPAMEKLKAEAVKLDRYRPTDKELGGEGERLGAAYRLKNGDVVYVPDGEAPGTSR